MLKLIGLLRGAALILVVAGTSVFCQTPAAPEQELVEDEIEEEEQEEEEEEEESPPPSPGTVLLTEGFEDADLGSRGWYDNDSPNISTVEVHDGSGSLELHFDQNDKIPNQGGASRIKFAPTESVYLSYWVKYSANWVGSGKNYHPHEFYFVTTEDDDWVGPSFTHLTTYVEQIYQNGGIPTLRIQDGKNIDQTRVGQDLTDVTESRSVAGCNGVPDGYDHECYEDSPGTYTNSKAWKASTPYFLPNPGPGYKNDWHFVEAFFQLNTIDANGKGQPDGIIRYWFDDELVMEFTDVYLRTGQHPDMKFNQLLIGLWIGDGSPVGQTLWIDDLTVATDRP